MADNLNINEASTATTYPVATDEISGAHHQRVKIQYGGDGSATDVSQGTPLPVEDYLMEVALGNVSGQVIVQKFGQNAAVGTTFEPITKAGVYQTPTAATALEVVSSDANDTSAGTGAQQVTIVGLDSSWNEVSQTISMNGTTAVAVPTSLVRVYRWYVSRSGTYATATAGSHVGTLTLRVASAGATWSTIDASAGFPEGQSEIGVYTVPDGKTGYILQGDVEVESTKAVDLILFQRPGADDVTTPFSAMRLVHRLPGIADRATIAPRTALGPFVGPCDIGFMGKVASGTAEVSVSFEVLVIDD